MSRWPLIALGVVGNHRHFHPMGWLLASKVDIDAYACLISGLLEKVETFFGRPPDIKNNLNDNNDATFAGFKLALPLSDRGNWCAHVVAMSMPKKWITFLADDSTTIWKKINFCPVKRIMQHLSSYCLWNGSTSRCFGSNLRRITMRTTRRHGQVNW